MKKKRGGIDGYKKERSFWKGGRQIAKGGSTKKCRIGH